MTREPSVYSLELQRADGGGTDFEELAAASDEEAIELAHLKLLLGSNYCLVRILRGDMEVATFRRDSTSRPFSDGTETGKWG